MGNFTLSGQAEILRAAQKDVLHSNNLQELLSDIVFKIAGNRVWLKWRSFAHITGKLAYYGLTTLSNFQTIGEEYTGIIQVDKTLRQMPTKTTRLLMILLDSCGLQVFLSILQWLEHELRHPKPGSELTSNARAKLLQTIEVVGLLLPFLQRFHMAAFFLSGSYYHLSKRLTGIHYVLVRSWLADRRSVDSFRLLGIVSMIYLLVHSGQLTHNWWKNSKMEASNVGELSKREPSVTNATSRCSLCMDERRNTSVTSCGHLFCWACIMQWLQTNLQCPMCREVVLPNRVIILQNYSCTST